MDLLSDLVDALVTLLRLRHAFHFDTLPCHGQTRILLRQVYYYLANPMISEIQGGGGYPKTGYRPGASQTTQTARHNSDHAIFFRSYPQSSFRKFAQAFGCALGGDVALRSS